MFRALSLAAWFHSHSLHGIVTLSPASTRLAWQRLWELTIFRLSYLFDPPQLPSKVSLTHDQPSLCYLKSRETLYCVCSQVYLAAPQEEIIPPVSKDKRTYLRSQG